MTDDGGVLLSVTAGPEGASDGELLAMKVFVESVSVTPDESPVRLTLRKQRAPDAWSRNALRAPLRPAGRRVPAGWRSSRYDVGGGNCSRSCHLGLPRSS